MSADNYYVVRIHPEGGYTYVMGFASDDEPDLRVDKGYPRYDSLGDALSAALNEYSEYGVDVHPECYVSENADIPDTVSERRHPYGPCYHTKYEDCPPCVHSAWEEGVQAAREAVAAIPAPYKVLGEYDTYSPYHEGKSGMQDAALAAIDALRGES